MMLFIPESARQDYVATYDTKKGSGFKHVMRIVLQGCLKKGEIDYGVTAGCGWSSALFNRAS